MGPHNQRIHIWALLCCALMLPQRGAAFSGAGAGTPADPYQIATLAQLQEMQNDLGASYALVADIDASPTRTWNGGAGFAPVGSETLTFTGSFDGKGHKIKGLFIHRPTTDFVALFGRVKNGYVGHVRVEDADITGRDYVGALVGHLWDYMQYRQRGEQCSSSGRIKGRDSAGGIVGALGDTTLADCYSTAAVESDTSAGGLCGGFGFAWITRCYAAGDVTGAVDYVGGLVGHFGGSSFVPSHVRQCFAAGRVSAPAGASFVGGAIGNVDNAYGSVADVFYADNSRLSPHGTWEPGGADAFKGNTNHAVFSPWDFQAVWKIRTAPADYPVLQCEVPAEAPTAAFAAAPTSGIAPLQVTFTDCSTGTITNRIWDFDGDGVTDATNPVEPIQFTYSGPGNYTARLTASGPNGGDTLIQSNCVTVLLRPSGFSGAGTGTPADPYQIATLAQLQEMLNNLGASYVLVADIDAAPTRTWNGGAGFDPVGTQSAPFYGTLNGAAHTVAGLFINRPSADHVGLFGYILHGSVTSIRCADADVTGRDIVGILAGRFDDAFQYRLKGQSCSSRGVVRGRSLVGGLIGVTYDVQLQDCYSMAAVTGTGQHVGGFSGSIAFSTLRRCYASGSVTGGDCAGGLVGTCGGTATVGNYLLSCFAAGRVAATGTSRGGLVGYLNGSGPYYRWDNSYYVDTRYATPCGIWEPAGPDAFKGNTNHNVFSQWSFPAIWITRTSPADYPVFQWEPVADSLTNGLVLHYSFDADAGADVPDSSGMANTGTAYNTTWVSNGISGGALSFGGDYSYIKSVECLPDMESITIGFWCKVRTWGDMPLLFDGDASGGSDLMVHLKPTNELQFWTKDNHLLNVPDARIPTNQWFYLTVIADRARGRKQIWINGSKKAEAAWSGNANVGFHYNLHVGCLGDGQLLGSFYDGTLDDVRIYNRGLTAGEVAQLYQTVRTGVAALTVTGDPEPHGTSQPFGYGTHFLPLGTTPAHSVSSPEPGGSGTQFVCTGWTGTGSAPASGSTTNTGPFALTSDSTIAWQWRMDYWLDTETNGDGTVDIADGWQAGNTDVLITATPSANFRFAQWLGQTNGCVMSGNLITVPMSMPRLIAAVFAPLPGVVQFQSSTGDVGENGGHVRIRVSRADGAYGAASVRYETADGTATGGREYTPTSGILSWSDGDSSDKDFDVTILDNPVYGGSRAFSVRLSDAAGAQLGLPSSMAVTILEDEEGQPPSVQIVSPTAAPAYGSRIQRVNLSGTATDNVGVVSVRVRNDRENAEHLCSGTAVWQYGGLSLYEGSNVITITAYDAAGNSKAAVLIVSYVLSSLPTDYDGDRVSDLAVFDRQTANWWIRSGSSALPNPVIAWKTQWGFPGCVPVPGDYDGDGAADLAVFHQATGSWWGRRVDGSVVLWGRSVGQTNAIPVPADYDGDGLTDLAAFTPHTGSWRILPGNPASSTPTILWDAQWGFPGCVPVPGDYDGDGIADLALFHEATGNWWIRRVDGSVILWGRSWGFAGCVPVPGDYDGDGVSDLAVFEQQTGNWWIQAGNSAVSSPTILWQVNWGFAGCVPVPGDYDGDGVADLAVFHEASGNWWIRRRDGTAILTGSPWGFPGCSAVGHTR